MQFVRKKRRGQKGKSRRTWFSQEGYRIGWSKEVHGVRVPGHYQACVRTLVPYFGGELRQMWDFVDHKHRLYKTYKAAEEACERNQRLWTKAQEAGSVRALRELFGKIPLGLPMWARKGLDRRLYAILTDNQPVKYREEEDECSTSTSAPCEPSPTGPTSPSSTSAESTEPTLATPTPASPAEAKARSRTQESRPTPLKATDTPTTSTARNAKAPAKGRKPRAAKPTKRASKSTGGKRASSSGSQKPAKKPSARSRKSKSKPSAN